MITQEVVVQKILAHLNGEMREIELVHWAEAASVSLSESNADVPGEGTVLDVLGIYP